MNVNYWKLWQDTFSLINTILYKKIMLMSAIERRKTFLTRASYKTGSTSITQQCFIILEREGPSLIFVFYTTVADKYDTVLLRNTKQRVETKYTQNAPAQFPADGGCCFGFASKFLTELSASKCENRTAQKIDTHTLIYLTTHLIPN